MSFSGDKEIAKMKQSKFPAGWDEERVRKVLAHYEGQTEHEEFSEIEAAHDAGLDSDDSGDNSRHRTDM